MWGIVRQRLGGYSAYYVCMLLLESTFLLLAYIYLLFFKYLFISFFVFN